MRNELAQPPCRVLIAEDDDEMRALLESVLLRAGYHVTAVDTGSALLDAFDHASARLPQERLVVVSDVVMPGRAPPHSGLEVLAEIRKRGSTAPVILISGFADEELRRAAERWGVTDLIAKPFDVAVLVEALAQATSHVGATPPSSVR